MKSLNLSIGYPLGYDIENTKKYNIEVKKTIIQLNKVEYMLWCELSDPIVENRRIDKTLLEGLINKAVVVEADNLKELFVSIAYFQPVRQGIGYINNKMFSIILGETYYNPKKNELIVWNKCDGIKTVVDICNELIDEYKLTTNDFIKTLLMLTMGNLVILR